MQLKLYARERKADIITKKKKIIAYKKTWHEIS